MNISQQAMAFLSWWVVQEVQKYFSIVSTERLNINPSDHRYFHVNGSYVKIFIYGENTGSEHIEVYINITTNTARIIVPSIFSLIRADRIFDFDISIIDQDKLSADGSIEMEVNFTDVLDRIPIWETMPPQILNEPINSPPTVVGGFQQ